MKKTTQLSGYLLIMLAFFSWRLNGQTAHNFTLTPQTLCYTTGTNIASAGITATMSGATAYHWSALGSCTPVITNTAGLNTQVTFPCCGIFTITSTAVNGTSVIAVVSKTIAVICTNFVSISNPTALTVCAGSSKTITATGATSYTWSNSSVFASIVVTPSVSTCYTVTGTNGSGCTSSAVACVTVSPGVNISGNVNICAGASTTLTATGSSSYTWSPFNVGSVIIVSPSVSTCYYAYATPTAGCNSSDSICVNVIPAPNISVSGNSVVCSGFTNLSASGATNYTWMPGNLTGNSVNVNLSSNTCFTVTGASPGCTTASAVKCVTVLPTPTLSISGNGAICPGGSATLTVSGANTYSWTGPVNSTLATIAISPTTTTCFSVMGTNSLGCTAWSGTCVTVGGPSITITGPNAICVGGTATLTGTGALAYTWTPGFQSGGSIVVSPTTATCYTLTGYNGTCTGMAVKCVSVVTAPVISSTNTANSVCAGSSLLLQASGASSYTWLPFNVTGSSVAVTPTASGCYTVLGSNIQGCSGSSTGCFTVVPAPTVAISGPSVICSGNSATLTGSGATSYTWKPSLSTTTAIVVTPTASTCYTLIGSSNGCSVAAVKCLTVQSSNIFVSGNNTVCAGSNATITAFGSANYTWMPGNQTTSVIVVTPSVSSCYTVYSTVNSCTASGVKCVTVVPLPAISAISSSSVLCAGSTASLTASGASTYTWQPFNQTGASIIVSPTANVCYTVTGNAQGCNGSASGCLTVQPLPVISVAGSSMVCAGSSATLTPSGAVTYTWMPGNITGPVAVVTPVANTCYTVYGTGTNGCSNAAVKCITVQPTNITVTGSAYVCQGSSAVLTASGSASYTWLPGGATGPSITISPSVATCYTVLGNSNGCATSGVNCVTIQPLPVITTAISNSVYCSGYSYLFTASGASTYTWYPFNANGSQITHTANTSMCYTINGTSSAGCIGTATGCFSVNPTPTLSITGPTTAICSGVSATLTASGGTTYTWMPGNQTGAGIVVTPSASTCFTVIGTTSGCSSQAVKCLTVQPAVLAVTGLSVICQGGTSTLTTSGSSSYTWLPGNVTGTSIVVTPSASTCYTVLGTSSTGCNSSGVKCITVSQNPVITLSGAQSLCSGVSQTLSASGAASYTWIPFNLNGTVIAITPTSNTCYTVTGFGTNGCKGSAASCFSVIATPTITITGNTPLCQGESLQLTAAGATNYTWLPGGLSGTSVTVTPSSGSCYTVIGSDNNGCAGSAVTCATLASQPPLSVSGTTNICKNTSTSFIVSGAATYTWNTGSNSPTISVSPTVNTCYNVTGTGTTGCIRSATVCVNVVSNPVIAISGNTAICSGQTATLHASGASTYTWSTGATSPTIAVNPASNTSFTVNGQNSIGCPGTATVNVTVNGFPYIFVAPYDSVICKGDSITLKVSGAQSYSWNNGAQTGTITVSPAASTTLVVTGTSGVCHRSSYLPIIVEPCTGITTEDGIAGISVYPNPARAFVTIKNDRQSAVQFALFDITGRKILNGQFTTVKTLDLSDLSNGMYIIRFDTGTQTGYQRLIVEK